MNHRASENEGAVVGHPAAEGAAPKRIQLSRAKGWRLPNDAMKVDRSTQWGNPYCVGERISMKMARRWGWNISPEGQKIICQDTADAVARFRHCLHWDEAIHGYVRDQLRGHDLACWCALDAPCHADVLLEIANSDPAHIRALHDAIDDRILAAAQALPSKDSPRTEDKRS